MRVQLYQVTPVLRELRNEGKNELVDSTRKEVSQVGVAPDDYRCITLKRRGEERRSGNLSH